MPISNAPTRIEKLIGGALRNVTDEARFQDFLRQQLRAMENGAHQHARRSNGFLGGWVAQKSLVGELDDAWSTMLRSYDRQSDWPLEECLVAARLDQCPENQKRALTFPAALAKHLADHGYITEEKSRQLVLRATQEPRRRRAP